MEKSIAYNEIGVIFIPDYVLLALEANKVSLKDIDSGILYSHDGDFANDKFKLLADNLKNVSATDLEDIININNILLRVLLNTGYGVLDSNINTLINVVSDLQYDKENTYEIDAKKKYDLLNIYFNKDIPNDDILMSEDKNKVFTSVATDNNLFIVLHDGFTNFIVNNDRDVKKKFLNRLMDYMFTKLEKRRVYNSKIFSKFIATL